MMRNAQNSGRLKFPRSSSANSDARLSTPTDTRNVMALQAQVLAHFAEQNLHLTPTFLSTLITSIHPPPLPSTPALLTSFHASFLPSSLPQSAAPKSYLPASVPTLHNTSIPGPALVQVVHVQDIGTSRLAQLEALEKAITEAGPQGRRVVDLPVDEEGEEQPMQSGGIEGLSGGKSVCKILVEDGRGERVFGME